MKNYALQFGLVWLVAAALAGCQGIMPSKPVAETGTADVGQPETAPVEQVESLDLKSEYQKLAAGGGTVYAINASASKVRIYVFRAGLMAAKVGHNHVISAPKFEGYVHLPSDNPSQARFDVNVPLEDLVVDDPALRTETGGNFAGERSDADKQGTKKNMLGERGLDSAKFPVVHLKSVSISGDWPILVADVAVTLHGVTRQQSLVLKVRHSAEEVRATGTLVLRQTDFGAKPYTVLGGALSVQDPVAIEFELVGKPAAF